MTNDGKSVSGQTVFRQLRAIPGTTSGRVIIMVSLCYLLNMIDRNIVSVAAPDIQREFGLNNTQLGLAFSVFGFAYLLQAPVGWLCDKWGARRGLAVFGTIWSGATGRLRPVVQPGWPDRRAGGAGVGRGRAVFRP